MLLSNFHTEDPQILGATVPNLVTRATWCPGCGHVRCVHGVHTQKTCTGGDFSNSKFCVNMDYNYSVLSHLFQKAIAAQNPGMSRDQRNELRNNKGHEMTFQRYHRYAGKCSTKFKVRAFSRPTCFNHRNKWHCEVIS